MMGFKNKIVWVTGASSGIGKALAIQFSKLGANVVLSSRKESDLKEVEKQCQSNTFVLPLDLSFQDNFNELVKKVSDQFGHIDVLINNGGISQRSLASDTTLEVDRKLMEVNYFGTVGLTKAVLPVMQKQKSGHIITISSLSGKFGFFLRSAYSAAKFAQVGFFESLRLEEEKNNILISMVFPGFVRTNISQNALSGDGEKHGKLDNNQEKGISPKKCAQDIVNGILDEKHEIYTGGKEILMVKVKRFLPRFFYKILRKQSGT